MALVLDFLGSQKDYFQKASWQVYCNPGSGLQYVGKCSAEIEIDMGIENIEYFDNEGGVQVLYLLTQTKVDPKVNFSFNQVIDPQITALVFNLEQDTSDATYAYNFIGSSPADYSYFPWMFASKGLNGHIAQLVVRNGVCFSTGAWTSGAAGALASIPATVRMTQDTTITNTKRDLGYFRIQKRAAS
jgi:hypothetical protein